VNYTAGLNKIRTSPDHGTAYDIAGKELLISIHLKRLFILVDIYHSRINMPKSVKTIENKRKV
jgi:4-hydroxythreonine-4-phosphate dehydrogenase